MGPNALTTKENDANVSIQWVADRNEYSQTALAVPWAAAIGSAPLKIPYVQTQDIHRGSGLEVPLTSNMDVQLTTITATSQRLDGYIWALVKTVGGDAGKFVGEAVYYMQQGWRVVPDVIKVANDDTYNFVNSWDMVQETVAQPGGVGTPNVYTYGLVAGQLANLLVAAGTIVDPGAGTLRNKKFGGANAAGGLKTISPGPEAYRFDAYGIRNRNATFTPAGDGGQDMPAMGSMKFVEGGGNANEIPTANEKDDADAARWCCFAAPASFVGGAMNQFKFRSTTHTDLADPTSAVVHLQGDTVQTNYGRQRTFFWGNAANATVDAANKTQFDNRITPDLEFNILEGRRMGQLVIDPTQTTDDIQFDYQLKALYEYGNCQYEFGADGMPSRVVDNLIPVGPSAGIPTF